MTEYAHHYIYRIDDTETGQYYIGMRSCNVEPESDHYMGSGDWIKEHVKKFGRFFKKDVIKRFVKTVVEVCGNREEVAYREEILIGDFWKIDSLCMNRRPGGQGGCAGDGEQSQSYKPEKIRLWDHNTKTEIYMTRMEFGKTIGRRNGIRDLLSGRVKSVNGVVLYENKDDPYGIPTGSSSKLYNHKLHRLWDHNTKTELNITYADFSIRLGYTAPMWALLEGRLKSIHGIVLYENKNIPIITEKNAREHNPRYNPKKHHLWDIDKCMSFYATQLELMEIYGIDSSSVSTLVNGKRNSAKGLCLYENRHKPIRKRKKSSQCFSAQTTARNHQFLSC